MEGIGMNRIRNLTGNIHTAANGQKTYDVFCASSGLIPVIGRLLQQQFGFSPQSTPAIGLDEIVIEIEKDGIKLSLGWDIWSGAYVLSFCEEGSQWVAHIAQFLDDEFSKSIYQQYVST